MKLSNEAREIEALRKRADRLQRLVGATRAQKLAIARERGTHTEDEWHALVWIFNHQCLSCGISALEHKNKTGKWLTKDHSFYNFVLNGIATFKGWKKRVMLRQKRNVI